jgi:hypothetical protein
MAGGKLGRRRPVREGIVGPQLATRRVTIAAHTGRIVDARALAQSSIARGEVGSVVVEQAGHEWVLGFLALSVGDPAAALEQLRRSYEGRDRFT